MSNRPAHRRTPGDAEDLRALEVERGRPPIEYRVIRSKRRRRTIQVGIEAGEVVVRAPWPTTDREITDLLRERSAWLEQHREAIGARALESGTAIPYLGEPLELTVSAGDRVRARVDLDLPGLRVTLPQSVDVAEHPEATREALTRWLRARASEILPPRVEALAQELGWHPSRVFVRDQQRRWGSCAADRTIRLNWRLVMLDDALRDYVAVHELAHLCEANHSARFWELMDRAMPDHVERRRRLNEAGRRLPL